MKPTTLLLLTVILQPERFADRYPQLPAEPTCEIFYKMADLDRAELVQRYEAMTGLRLRPAVAPWGFPSWEPEGSGGGWLAQQLREHIREADRTRHAWYAVCSLRRCRDCDMQEEWAQRLALLVGWEPFWRGELPATLSVP
jgi:hypothetical protein